MSYLGTVVLGGTDEHSEIHRRLDVIDLLGVLFGALQDISRLPIKHSTDSSDLLTSITPCSPELH